MGEVGWGEGGWRNIGSSGYGEREEGRVAFVRMMDRS